SSVPEVGVVERDVARLHLDGHGPGHGVDLVVLEDGLDLGLAHRGLLVGALEAGPAGGFDLGRGGGTQVAGGDDLEEAVAAAEGAVELDEPAVVVAEELDLVGGAGLADVAVPALEVGLAGAAGEHAEE